MSLSIDDTSISNSIAISNASFETIFLQLLIKPNLEFPFRTRIFLIMHLKNRFNFSFFLSLTDEMEIVNTISSLDSKQSVGPKHFPTKILKMKLLKNEISSKIPDIFSNFFWCLSLNTKRLQWLSRYIRRNQSLIPQICVQSHFFTLNKTWED